MPPDFESARAKRQKVRAAGMDPDYWYAVEYERAVPQGKAVEITFWNRSIVVYRGGDGRLRALENRCAHRQLKLSLGEVNDCYLTCTYHGWTYDGDGNVVHYAHDLFGRAQPEVKVRSYPVFAKYGLIWLFPGDPARAADREIPSIPEIEGPNPWARLDFGFTWRAHHSMIIDNVSDFTHAYLHRKYRPFWDAKLTQCEMRDDSVVLTYNAMIGGGRFSDLFVDRSKVDTTSIDLRFDYPYQRSDTGGHIKHWCFVLPMNRNTTRVFFIFYFDAFKVPFLPVRIPPRLMQPMLNIAAKRSIRRLLDQDGRAVESEQIGYDTNFTAPIIELNPAVHMFQELTIRKWAEYLTRKKGSATMRSASRPAPRS
jgi:phenylpropionate dioxygenase-like ring-hydroxylating dioxygenase large terminal subunit